MILTFKRLSLLTLVFLGMAAFHTVKADPIKLFTTGVNDAGTNNAGGTVDSHYKLVVGTGTQSAYVLGNDNASPGSGWAANTSGSKWIVPGPGGLLDVPMGTYTYRTTFTIDPTQGYDLSTATINGTVFADDRVRIFINGVDTGIDLPTSGGSGYVPAALSSFLIKTGFKFGENTIDFVVANTPFAPTPSGLQVTTLTGSIFKGTPASVPEPATLILIGTGLAGIAARARRKKS